MNARDRVHAMLPILDSPAEADAREAEFDRRLDAFRAEELHAAADTLAPIYGAAAMRLRQLAEGKSSQSADATPGLNPRQARLLDVIRTWGGEWNTARVRHTYALIAPEAVQRGTARRDLDVLHRAGHLVLVDDPDNRHYVLRRKDGAV
ncbi:hypothetical protein [Streptomyces longwoodensis]|uniref:hypothetical protein n=1 Tax=Streptomyces longwoodensis TaxID=68231 RepID=UPI0036F01D38